MIGEVCQVRGVQPAGCGGHNLRGLAEGPNIFHFLPLALRTHPHTECLSAEGQNTRVHTTWKL